MSIYGWGYDNNGQASAPPSGTHFKQVSAGGEHAVALTSDGSVVSWGIFFGGMPTGPGFTQVSAGDRFALALRADGSIAVWGVYSYGLITGAPTGTGFTQVKAAHSHALALRADGSIVAWGRDFEGQVSGTPSGAAFTQVAGGLYHSLALRSDGSLVSWGDDQHGQVSNTPSEFGFTQVASGYMHSLALRMDGSIVAWGNDGVGNVITNAPGGFEFMQLSGGQLFALALYKANVGNPFCFGDGTDTSCPCGTHGHSGEGCLNSTTTAGATLSASGNASLSFDFFRLHVSNVPGSQMGLILQGANLLVGSSIPAGDGLLCTNGQSLHSQIQVTTEGSTTFTHFLDNPFGASSYGVGVPTNYQFWYRDPANTCSGAGFNFSNAWTVNWLR